MTEETKKRSRKSKVVEGQTVNWEKLAKHLQEALESSIKENEAQRKENVQLVRDNLKLMGIIGYLERKVGRADYSV